MAASVADTEAMADMEDMADTGAMAVVSVDMVADTVAALDMAAVTDTTVSYRLHMSLVMRKPAFCICKNKEADQLRGNREADQRLCFRY